MTPNMASNTSPYGWRFWYVLFSILCSIYAFFLNSALLETFQEQLIKEYFDFTRTIYSPQKIYLAESILFSWGGFLLGAGKHWLYYKLYCSFAIVLALPAIAYFAASYFENAIKSWAFLLVFVLSSQYFWGPYYIGMPDPLISILLVVLILQQRPLHIFIVAVLATLTHFSISTISIFCVSLLLASLPNQSRQFKITYIKYALLGLVTGRALLALWYFRFKYDLNTRVDYVTDLGFTHFVDRYLANVSGFWLAPGWIFLGLFVAISVWALYRKLFLFALSMYITLVLAYASLFFTRDGLRVFALVMTGPYAFMLKTVIDNWVATKHIAQPPTASTTAK
jgi:hypothetical protein